LVGNCGMDGGAAGGAEPRPYGSILVRKKTGGRFVNRPYGVDAGAGRNIAGLMARNVGATLAVARKGRKVRFFAALRMTGTGDMRRAGSPRHTGPYPSRRGLSRGKHAVAHLKSRPRGARVNTFPRKRARLRIPPPLRGPPEGELPRSGKRSHPGVPFNRGG
jgi:hypothetical protein